MGCKPPFGCAWCPLTNRRKTGCEAELFLKNPKKYFEGFLSGVSRISRVWGRHSPTRFPQGQNERKANFGTAVESCSEKLPLSLCAAALNTYKTEAGQKDGKSGGFFLLPFLQFTRAAWLASVNIAIAAACSARFCSPPRIETENAKRSFEFLHHYYGRQVPFC